VRLSFVKPRLELQPYIESFWVFESATGIALTDRNLAVPNGCPKLIIPYENSLSGISEDRTIRTASSWRWRDGSRKRSSLIPRT